MKNSSRLEVVLRPGRNGRGDFLMGPIDFPGTTELDELVAFVYPRDDGSATLVLEKKRQNGKRKQETLHASKE